MKTMYEVQDMMDDLYNLVDEIGEEVNNLLTENENLKARLAKVTKDNVVHKLKAVQPKKTVEEILYEEYYKEFYGKELS